eukprot:GHVN01028199.1.p1 GENE.GHVN01028199.1~~GHVN01028199.1.p1  ORF type:complete len:203 (-),score=27.29 GHVN01028199.1:135-743(-)
MLGDMVLPGMQHMQAVDFVTREVQLRVLGCAHRAVNRAFQLRHPKEASVVEEVREGDLIAFRLSDKERHQRSFMRGKSLPQWSEPSRVIKVLGGGRASPFVVRSLWGGQQRQVARADLPKIHQLWNRGLQELANATLLVEWPEVKQDPSKWGQLVWWHGGPITPGVPPNESPSPIVQEEESKLHYMCVLVEWASPCIAIFFQ